MPARRKMQSAAARLSSAAARQGAAVRGQRPRLTRDAPRQEALAGYQQTFSALLRVRRAALLLDELWRDLVQAAGAQTSFTTSFRLSYVVAGLRVHDAAVLWLSAMRRAHG